MARKALPPQFDENGKQICGAKTSKGTPCRKPPKPGKNRCKLHGGNNLSGIAHPNYKDGRYTNDIPARLVENYEAAKNDPNLLSVRDDMALLEARIRDLLKRVDSGESGRLWRQLRETYQAFRRATNAGEDDEAKRLLSEIGQLINAGYQDAQAWTEIENTIERKRKLGADERKRLVEMEQMIQTDRMLLVAGALVDAVRKHVSDRDILNAISTDLGAVLRLGATAGVDGGPLG